MILTIIINLKHDEERKKKMIDKLKFVDLKPVLFFDAIGINDLYKYDYKTMEFFINPETNLSIQPGEIGCALSHYYVWKFIEENNYEKVLILEDDTIFLNNFNEELNNILSANEKYDIFFLNRTKCSCIKENKINNYICMRYSYNANAYIITNNCVNKLILSEYLNNIIPVDEFFSILYDSEYPYKQYNKYNERITALCLENDITDQELRTVFPSNIHPY